MAFGRSIHHLYDWRRALRAAAGLLVFLTLAPFVAADGWPDLLPAPVAQSIPAGPTNCALVVVAWHGPATQPKQVAVRYYAAPVTVNHEPLPVPGQTVRITEDFRELGLRFWRLAQSPSPQPVTGRDNQRLDRALGYLGEGDPTFVGEQTIEPWHVLAILPDAGPFLPRSLRSRVRRVVLETELGVTEWHSRLRLDTADNGTAEQVGQVVAGWRELALSLSEAVAAGGVAHRLREALTQQPVRVLSNQVVAAVVLPGELTLRTGKKAVRYGLLNSMAAGPATNGLSASSARLDEVRRWAKEVPGAGTAGLVAALRDPSPSVRALAAWALAAAHDPQLVAGLQPLLEDEHERVRAAAAWAVSQTGAADVGALLAVRARRDPSELVRYRAVAGLGALRLSASVPALVDALADAAPAVREQAALSLRPMLGQKTAPPELLKMALNPRTAARRLALTLLGHDGGEGAETALRAGLTDAEPVVCAAAVLGLGRRRATIATADSQRLLAHDDEHVRGATAHALFLAGDRSAAKWLRPLLTDPHPFVRAVAAESLSQWGEPTVKPPAGFSAAAVLSYPF